MRFGQYEILGRIAVGGMAEVYRGRAVGDEGFEKPVAIKRILPPYAGDARFVSMLVTEARIHSSLSHKNIVQIHDLGLSEEGEHFIVLEYVDGRDLAALLDVLARTTSPGGRALRLSDAVALHVIIELGEGVHFAHELRGPEGPLGLVHRDISPSNVLISYSGEVKLSDFGLAKRTTDHSVVGSLKGKLAYMSPEQARCTPLDRRTDIFALGAVLFEMLTGRRLRDITDEVEGWRQVASGLVPAIRSFRPDLPPALERVLSGALAPDQRDRFPDARSFVAAARDALAGVPRAPTSEVAELQDLLRSVLPPGTPRPPGAPSKVIRLVSEFLPPDQTVRARAPGHVHAKAALAQPAEDPDDPEDPLDGRTEPRAQAPGLPPAAPAPDSTANTEEVAWGSAAAPDQAAWPEPSTVEAAAWQQSPTANAPAWPQSSTADAAAWAQSSTADEAWAQSSTPDDSWALSSTDDQGWRPPTRLPRRQANGSIALFVLALLPGIASLVHYFVIPLPVLATWSAPARLDVVSAPAGAAVLLDGRPLSERTPTYTEVARDHETHVVEVRKDGFQSARRIIRFDRAEILSVTVSLQGDLHPSISPMPEGPAPTQHPTTAVEDR
jgi:serine/threonine protein kinase